MSSSNAAKPLFKEPIEDELFHFEFRDRLPSGETLQTVIVSDNSSSDISRTNEAVSGSRAQTQISGGTAGNTWEVIFDVTTTPSAYKLRGRGILKIL